MNHRIYKSDTGHAITEAAVHAEGIYGDVGFVLSTADALALGCTLGTMLVSKKRPLVIVGYDNRKSSESLESEICRGLASSGCYVMRAGIAPSPALQFSAHCLDAATVMVSGSSEPYNVNGFFLCIEQTPLYGNRLQRLVALAANGSANKNRGGVIEGNILEAYVKKLKKFNKKGRKLKIVWDLCSGTACRIIPDLTSDVSGEHLLMNDELDPLFGELKPDSFDAERQKILAEVIADEKCDIGVIINADCRQVSITDDLGYLWTPAHIFSLLLRNMPKTESKPLIVVGVDCHASIRKVAEQAGVGVIYAGTDMGSILERMVETDALLGFSHDGRFAFGKAYDYAPFEDAVFTVVTLLNLLTEKPKPLSDYRAEMTIDVQRPKRYFQHKNPDEILQAVRRRLIQQNRQMFDLFGVRCDTEDGWWWLHEEGKHLVLEVSATNEHDLSIAARDAEQIMTLITSEVSKPEEVAESVVHPVKTAEKAETPTEKALKDISDTDRETIDFTSRHWRSIRKKHELESSLLTLGAAEKKRPWKRKPQEQD